MKKFISQWKEASKQPNYRLRVTLAVLLMPLSTYISWQVLSLGTTLGEMVTFKALPILAANPEILIFAAACWLACICYAIVRIAKG